MAAKMKMAAASAQRQIENGGKRSSGKRHQHHRGGIEGSSEIISASWHRKAWRGIGIAKISNRSIAAAAASRSM